VRFLYDFLNYWEGEVFFLLSPLQCTVTEPVEIRKRLREFKKYIRGCASLKKYKAIFRGYAAEVTVNSKEGYFLSGFHPRIRPLGFQRSFCICFFRGTWKAGGVIPPLSKIWASGVHYSQKPNS
jgi:hypothetical protein